MGNICGKESKTDNFSQPGRVVGSAPAPAPKTAPVPKKVGGPPRTLGGGGNSTEGGSTENATDARRRAAEAAEARANAANKPGGKLGKQLAESKRQSRQDTLTQVSREQVQARDADEAAKARNWD